MNMLVEVDIDSLNETLLDYLVCKHTAGSDEAMYANGPQLKENEIILHLKDLDSKFAIVFGKITVIDQIRMKKIALSAFAVEAENLIFSNKLYEKNTLTSMIFNRRMDISFKEDLITATLGQFTTTHVDSHIAVLSTVLKSVLSSTTVHVDPSLIEACDTSVKMKAEIREKRRLLRAQNHTK